MEFSVTILDKEVRRKIAELKRRCKDTQPAMHEIGQRYERRVLENFAKEQAPDGTPWKPTKVLSNYLGYVGTTKGGKRRSAYTKKGGFRSAFARYLANKKILVLSGRLKSRIHYQADGNSVRIGVAGIPYAAIHQFGGMAGRGRKVEIPAREYLAMNEGQNLVLAPQDRSIILDVIRRHLEEAV